MLAQDVIPSLLQSKCLRAARGRTEQYSKNQAKIMGTGNFEVQTCWLGSLVPYLRFCALESAWAQRIGLVFTDTFWESPPKDNLSRTMSVYLDVNFTFREFYVKGITGTEGTLATSNAFAWKQTLLGNANGGNNDTLALSGSKRPQLQV